MVLIIICILLTVLLGYKRREHCSMIGECVIFLLVTVIASCVIESEHETTDMTGMVIVSCDYFTLADAVTLTADGASTRVAYILEDGTISNAISSKSRLIYDATDTSYLIKMTYKYPDIRGFLFAGYNYTYYEFHLRK